MARTPGSRLRLSRRAGRSGRLSAVAVGSALLLVVAGCTRSSDETEDGGGQAAPPPAATTAAAAPGDFGTLRGICGPGDASTPTGRGVTADTITVGVSADPGSDVTPGLGQEFFDVADAFVAWCNEAGGINGREIVLNKHDAKLLEAGQRMVEACQTDFMVVGGGNVVDAPAVQPRVDCGLGAIPAYGVSPEALNAPLQVRAAPNTAQLYPAGAFRLMAQMFPESSSSLGIGNSSLATIRPQGLRLRQALTQYGYTVSAYQEMPPLVTNYRPFMEELKNAGVRGYQPIGIQDLTPLVTAMNNVGLDLDFMLVENQLYNDLTKQAFAAAEFPPTWVVLTHLPWELADEYPVMKQARDIVTAKVPDADFTDFTALGFSAWTLWAKSATACGDNLTVQCVLDNAAKERSWTAGGIYPEGQVLTPGEQHISNCLLLMKVTEEGFVYDREATKPTDDIYNCDPQNVVTLTETFDEVAG
ncbi:MAG: ABC transporter substrate-binding protein [Frankia sp.]|nr:ABC transporter substrate-binding protein [Frankia sp.]